MSEHVDKVVLDGKTLLEDFAKFRERDQKVEEAVASLLDALGYDRTKDGLSETPARVRKFLVSVCDPAPFSFTAFDSEGMNEMVVQSGIPFHSLCEHHMLPFVGTATVGYIPDGKIVGLSKLARAVRYNASGLQNQERITTNVARMLANALQTENVAVVLRARHLCMEMRGVQAHDTYTTTSKMCGAFRDDGRARAEFLRLADGR